MSWVEITLDLGTIILEQYTHLKPECGDNSAHKYQWQHPNNTKQIRQSGFEPGEPKGGVLGRAENQANQKVQNLDKELEHKQRSL